MNEAETRAELIDPALRDAGWGVVPDSRVRREERITLGRIEGLGRRAKPEIADYVLTFRNHKLGVIEAKARDKPDTITFANSGVGSTNHLSAELFKRAAKIEIQHVPYRGGGPALADLSGGHVTAMFATLPSAV